MRERGKVSVRRNTRFRAVCVVIIGTATQTRSDRIIIIIEIIIKINLVI